jgi:hypothetical protein
MGCLVGPLLKFKGVIEMPSTLAIANGQRPIVISDNVLAALDMHPVRSLRRIDATRPPHSYNFRIALTLLPLRPWAGVIRLITQRALRAKSLS